MGGARAARLGLPSAVARHWYTQYDLILDGEPWFCWTMGDAINCPDGSPLTILINGKPHGTTRRRR